MSVRPARRRVAAALALALGLAAGGAHAAERPAEAPEPARAVRIDGAPYVDVHDLARLLDATQFWRADVRKLVLRAGSHRVTLTVDHPFVIVDDRTLRLDRPVRVRRGEMLVPVALLDSLPRDSTLARLAFDAVRGLVLALPAGGLVRSPRLAAEGAITRVTFPTERVADVAVIGRARNRFRIRFDGWFTGQLPDSLAPDGLVRAIRSLPAPRGSAFELELSPEARGFRLEQGAERVTLAFSRADGAGFEPFAPEGGPGPRALRTIVLDPGHGGAESGTVAEGAVEKDLALRLARRLGAELSRRHGTRVILTRDRDVTLGAAQRAEVANRSRADLFVSLHFDGYPSGRARGVTCWFPPATFAEAAPPLRPGIAMPVEVLAWRDVALRHAVPARALAEALRASLELAGLGPVRVREQLAAPFLGVNAPALLVECGTLTAAGDRARLVSDDGLATLAAALADGIDSYRRND